MAQGEVKETVLAIRMTEALEQALAALHENWRRDPATVPKGLMCSESGGGERVVVAAESVFTTLPGALVVKSLGAIEMPGVGPVFEEGAHSRSLIFRQDAEGWRLSVKYTAPVARERKARH